MGLVVMVLAGVAATAALTFLDAEDRLQVVRDRLQVAVDAVGAGDIAAADDAFAQAEDAAGAAVGRVRSPLVRLVGFLPVIGPTVDSVVATTEAADLIAGAGRQITASLRDIPGGLDALTLGGGGEAGWLDAVQTLQDPVVDAAARLELARDLVEHAPARTRVARVDAARTRLLDELTQINPIVQNGAALAGALPTLFGDEQPRRYFLGAHNPAELRGTGGFIGAYAILIAEAGEVTISPFTPTQELPQDVLDEDTAPTATFLERYGERIAGNGTWLNVNLSADLPTVADAIQAMYQAAEGQRLDGVILVDPFALEAMLRTTGPVTSPDPDVGTLTADTVVPFITTEAPIALGFGGERKEVLGESAQVVLDEFLSGDVPGRARIDALAEAVSGGHLLIHAADPEVQAVIEAVGAGGGLPEPEGTVAALSLVNTTAGKADVWLDRTVDWDVTLDPDGTASAIVTVALSNGTPEDPSLPRYITGPADHIDLPPGTSRPQVSLACGECEPLQVSWSDAGDYGYSVHREAGHVTIVTSPVLEPGEEVTVRFVVDIPRAWGRSGTGGVVTPTFWTAPSILGTDVDVTLTPPPGWAFDQPEQDGDVRIDGGRAIIEGTDVRELSHELTLSVQR
ncbi:DUF4012 domain-containing protein [Euzebya sp.]|uniref:DUF4012 domain-containing protein n=1 Tax=Euzebya sp. TaxID=1971409 RepID=UPI003559761F